MHNHIVNCVPDPSYYLLELIVVPWFCILFVSAHAPIFPPALSIDHYPSALVLITLSVWTIFLSKHEKSKNMNHNEFFYQPLLPTRNTFHVSRLSWLLRSNKKANRDKGPAPFRKNTPLSEDRLRFQSHLLEHIQQSIMVLNTNGDIIYSNQAARCIFKINPNRKNHLSEASLPFNKSKIIEIRNQVLSGQIWKEQQQMPIDGKNRVLLHHAHALYQDQNLVPYIVVISTDISDLLEARISSEIANSAKSQFLANVTHELRTPMIGILGSVEIIEKSDFSAEQLEHIQAIKECGEHLLQTVNELLNVSEIELGLTELICEPINLADLFIKCAWVIEKGLQVKNMVMEVTLDPHLPSVVMLDEVKLRQVLFQLLYNAVKFSSEGTIQLRADLKLDSDQSSWMMVSVSDTGIGIPAEKLDIVFDPFIQVDSSSHRKYGGTGLGLYTCRRLIELMKGKIWAKSVLHQGSCFYFSIPLEIASADVFAETFSSPEPHISNLEILNDLNAISVLVVEDNDLNQKLISRMLFNYGFDVQNAFNGMEAISLLQSKDYDIILMDMHMPVMDGYETTQRIRENPQFKDIPIIAIPANAMLGDQGRCLTCGCSSYLPKPFKSEELVREIKNILQISCKPKRTQTLLVNQIIDELLPEFMESMGTILSDLEDAITIKDLPAVMELGHAIKGTAGMYGFTQISEFAAMMEKAASEGALNKVDVLHLQLSGLYQELNLKMSQSAQSN